MFIDKSINAGLYKSLVFAFILSATIRFMHTAGATDENWTLFALQEHEAVYLVQNVRLE